LLLSLALNISVPVDMVYKPLHNKSVNDFMYAARSRFNVDPIDMKDFSRELIKRKSMQRAYCISADQKPGSKSRIYTTEFLNRETSFFVGPEKIAQFVEAPVAFCTMQRVKQGYYQASFKVIAEPPYQKQSDDYPITERYVRELENLIKEVPQNWLWSNRRWRSRSGK